MLSRKLKEASEGRGFSSSAKLKEKPAKELAALGYSISNGNEMSDFDSLMKAIAGVSVTSQPDHTKFRKVKER